MLSAAMKGEPGLDQRPGNVLRQRVQRIVGG
jgi:hypothetical protein